MIGRFEEEDHSTKKPHINLVLQLSKTVVRPLATKREMQ
jgi:hypothetical protein